MDQKLKDFVSGLHPSTTVLSYGKAHQYEFPERKVDAVEVRNLYGQRIVWGCFSVEHNKSGLAKFKGRLANNSNTEGVTYIKSSPFVLLKDRVFQFFVDLINHTADSYKVG